MNTLISIVVAYGSIGCAVLIYIAHKMDILNDISHSILHHVKEIRGKEK